MPSINEYFLKQLQDDYKRYPCFIETGTNKGETIVVMEPHFEKLHTIEFDEKYYNYCRQLYSYKNKINFILGDSSVVFKSLLPNVMDKSIFFLDGHWIGGDNIKSEKDCPLIEEVTHINNLFKPEGILIIDDFRLFGLDASSGKLGEDWSAISKKEIISILSSRISKVYHLDSPCAKDDRLIIHINAI
jgi:hypothetical protein